MSHLLRRCRSDHSCRTDLLASWGFPPATTPEQLSRFNFRAHAQAQAELDASLADLEAATMTFFDLVDKADTAIAEAKRAKAYKRKLEAEVKRRRLSHIVGKLPWLWFCYCWLFQAPLQNALSSGFWTEHT